MIVRQVKILLQELHNKVSIQQYQELLAISYNDHSGLSGHHIHFPDVGVNQKSNMGKFAVKYLLNLN